MLNFLKNHPFAVEAYFESSLVLTFAFPKDLLEQMIPACLSLDCLQDKYAFVAVAMVQTKHLRPKGFPEIMGNDFFLIGYRIFVQYRNKAGKRLRGLYILKSETDKRKMSILGNIFTRYKYCTTDIFSQQENGIRAIQSTRSAFTVRWDRTGENTDLPAGSPFSDWKEARRFAGPLPFTFTYDPTRKEVLIIEGVRQNWVPEPITVVDWQFSFFEKSGLNNPVLANAFLINNIPYYWKKGVVEKWNH